MSVKLDETGLHASECACARCEAGFRPSMKQRWTARRALDNVRRRAAAVAARAAAPAEMPSVAARIAASRLSIAASVEDTKRGIEQLRAAERASDDPRNARFLALRAEGLSRVAAMQKVDEEFPEYDEPQPTNGDDDD